jgi:lipoate-protein ligase A
MAVDEMLFIRCQENKNFPPTLRIYDWSEPAISIGYFQDAYQAINVQKAQLERVSLVRRITGGRAVLHFGELTYAVVANSSNDRILGTDLRSTYQEISLATRRALQKLGIRAEYKRGRAAGNSSRLSYHHPCFESISSYELTANGRKLVGSAQRRSQGCFLQHGSIPRSKSDWKIEDYLSPSPGEDAANQHSWDEKSTSLSALTGRKMELEELKRSLKEGFADYFGISFVEEGVTKPELKLAFRLERDKYSQECWNLNRVSGPAYRAVLQSQEQTASIPG